MFVYPDVRILDGNGPKCAGGRAPQWTPN